MGLGRRSSAVVVSIMLVGLLGSASPAPAAMASLSQVYRVDHGPIGRYQTDVFGQIHGLFSSPAVGDVTCDGVLDLVTGNVNGFLAIDRADTGARQRSIEVGVGTIVSSPTLTDLNDDGRLDVLVGLMPTDEAAAARTIGGYDGATGALLFSKRTCTLPDKTCNVFSTLAVGDLDGDGDEDIVATSQDHHLHAWRDDGSYLPGFPVFLADTTWSSPALADIDGDGANEIVVAADLDGPTCAGNPALGCGPPGYGGMLWVVEATGAVANRRFIPAEIPLSSPAIGDVDGDGRLEIAIGAGNFYAATGRSSGHERRVTVYRHDLALQPGWPRELRTTTISSPALVDVDGDGRFEIAVGDGAGWLYLFDADGTLRWEQCARDPGRGCGTADVGIAGSPAAGDVDGDGDQEVVYVGETTMQVRDGRSGAVEWEQSLYSAELPLGNQVSTPTIFSDAGTARIAYHALADPAGDGRNGNDHDLMFLFASPSPLGRADWPAFRGDARTRRGSVAAAPGPGGFSDTAGNVHGDSIATVAGAGIAAGFPDGTFRPRAPVSRGQMATFLARGYQLPPGNGPTFADSAGSIHEPGIRAVAAAGIALGGADGRFRPADPVTRGQMAAFLARAEELPPGGGPGFCDTAGHLFEDAIRAVAAAGIALGDTAGCYRPAEIVNRGQMATFLTRALGL
ncbi:hypothetical protein BH20ACT2_BH20ACT2_19000 [soil metagenome]